MRKNRILKDLPRDLQPIAANLDATMGEALGAGLDPALVLRLLAENLLKVASKMPCRMIVVDPGNLKYLWDRYEMAEGMLLVGVEG